MKPQQGNALFLILIAVALFAGLSYAITRSGRGAGTASKENDILLAAEILQYASTVKQAYQRLALINGCTDNQMSFENPVSATNYANNRAPLDKSCHLFDPAGGGLQFKQFSTNIRGSLADSSNPAPATAQANFDYAFEPKFNGRTDYKSTTFASTAYNAEIMMILTFVKREICVEINKQIGFGLSSYNSTDIDLNPISTVWAPTVIGTASTILNNPALLGQEFACDYRQPGNQGYTFFFVIDINPE